MSTIIGGPGWWLASDGRWYPPETHPDYRHQAEEMWAAAQAENEAWSGGPAADAGAWSPEPVGEEVSWSPAPVGEEVSWSPAPVGEEVSWSPEPVAEAEPSDGATVGLWEPPEAESAGQPPEPLEMAPAGPIPPAFTSSNGPEGASTQVGRTIMIEPAKYLGGFAPEPEGQESSFLRCTEAGVQFRTRRGVAWVPWADLTAMTVEPLEGMSERFRANPQFAPSRLGAPDQPEKVAYVVAASDSSEVVFEVNGTTCDELRQAMQPVLDSFDATRGGPSSSGPAHAAHDDLDGEVTAVEAKGVATGDGALAGSAVERLLASAASQGLIEPLTSAVDHDAHRFLDDALDVARAASSAAQAAAGSAQQAVSAIERFVDARRSAAEIADLLVRCRELVERTITDAERQASQIVAAARADAARIRAGAAKQLGMASTAGGTPSPAIDSGTPPLLTPESARELNSAIDGYIKVNSELMRELRLLTETFTSGSAAAPSAPAVGSQPT